MYIDYNDLGSYARHLLCKQRMECERVLKRREHRVGGIELLDNCICDNGGHTADVVPNFSTLLKVLIGAAYRFHNVPSDGRTSGLEEYGAPICTAHCVANCVARHENK